MQMHKSQYKHHTETPHLHAGEGFSCAFQLLFILLRSQR